MISYHISCHVPNRVPKSNGFLCFFRLIVLYYEQCVTDRNIGATTDEKIPLVISLTRIDWFKDDFLFGTARVLEGTSDLTNRTIHIKGSFPVHDIGTCYECFATLGVDKRGGDQWRIDAPVETTPRDRIDLIRYLQRQGFPFHIANSLVTEHGLYTTYILDHGTPEDLAANTNEDDRRTGLIERITAVPSAVAEAA